MMKKFLACLAALAFALLPRLASADVVLFGAASVTDAVNEIGAAFAAQGLGRIVPSYASSSTLAKQIENGAPCGIFLSADERWMDYLAEKKLIVPASRGNLLGNRLVLIAPKDSPTGTVDIQAGFPLARLLGEGRLSVGDPAHVPVGLYTQSALEKLGVWDQVKDRIAAADSVRAALAFVERGEAPLGVVYATDAAIDAGKVKVVGTFPADSHPPVVYPVALVAGQDNAEAKAFLGFLQSPAAREIFRKYGFEVK